MNAGQTVTSRVVVGSLNTCEPCEKMSLALDCLSYWVSDLQLEEFAASGRYRLHYEKGFRTGSDKYIVPLVHCTP